MHIVFGVVGDVKVEHRGHVFDVQAPGGHVGANQQVHVAAFERIQRFEPLVLAFIAVQSRGVEAIALQRAGQPGTAQLAVDKHKGLGDGVLLDQLAQRAALVVVAHTVEMLADSGSGFIRSRHLNGDGVLQIAGRQALDLGRESGRKQQRDALLGQIAQDALQIGQKADVEHAVGLVEHHVLNLVEHHIFGLDVVQQPPRGGDQHLNAFFQFQRLGLHVHAAKHHGAAQVGVLGVSRHLLGHLVGQLAGGQQHQGTHGVAGWGGGGVFVLHHALQQGQRESGGFAGARLGGPHHIATRQDHRDGLLLDRGHGFVAHFGHGAGQLGGQLKV